MAKTPDSYVVEIIGSIALQFAAASAERDRLAEKVAELEAKIIAASQGANT